MNKTQIAIIGAAGLTGAGIWYLASSRHGDPDGYPLQGGVIEPDSPRLEQDARPGYIQDLNGNYHQIGTIDACTAAYLIAMEHDRVLTQMMQLVETSLTAHQRAVLHTGFFENRRYPLGSLDDLQRAMVVTMVSCAVNYGQALRLLSQMFQAAGMPTTEFRPTQARNNNDYGLGNIALGGLLNPNANHPSATTVRPTVWQIRRSAGWETAGILICREWMTAYGMAPASIEGGAELSQDWDTAEARAESNSIQTASLGEPEVVSTMGFAPIAWAIAIAIIAVGAGVAVAIMRGPELLSAFLGVNVALQAEQAEQYAAASECARDASRTPEERAACRAEAQAISTESGTFSRGWGSLAKWGIIGAVGVGATILYVKYGHKYAKKGYALAKEEYHKARKKFASATSKRLE